MRKDILAKALKNAKTVKFAQPKPPKKNVVRESSPPYLRVCGDKLKEVKDWKVGQEVTMLVKGKVKTLENWDGDITSGLDIMELSVLK